MKKFLLKLVNWQAQRGNNPARIHDADQQDQARLSREKNEQKENIHGKSYISNVTPPSEGEIVGPSDSKPEESQQA